METTRCVLSWVWAQIRPRKPEHSFEDWVINRFGERLFSIFFKTYTEKVWGLPCNEISADWAAQRIKNLNLLKAGLNALGLNFSRGDTIKTLIDEFRYPRLGPGMMWEKLSDDLTTGGCRLEMGAKVESIRWKPGGAYSVQTASQSVEGDSFFSSMPMRSLVRALEPAPPDEVVEAAEKLFYRDYLTVILVLDVEELFPDNWIYIHDPGVKVGRIQNYKNWSREMVPNPGYTCLGLEYFCDVGDELWDLSDSALVELGIAELEKLDLGAVSSLKDGTVVRMPKAYPVYDENYHSAVQTIRTFLEENVPNLQPIGRNGMHKYNNQDHAMWTGVLAARNALGMGPFDLWKVNADAEYLEESGAPIGDGRLVPQKV
jgi:protoporphyrinogen oxidase